MRAVVLGCGYHGRGIAYEIAAAGDVGGLLVADREAASARRVAERTGADWLKLDVHDTAALGRALDGRDLVFNAVGPYHLSGLGVVAAAIAAGVGYADLNDDHEVAEALFLDPGWERRAREAGVAVLTGLGMAPGLTGILARLGHQRLETTERIDIRFVWNYALAYPAALQHFLRINGGAAPQYIGGTLTRPGAFAGRETARFLAPVGDREVYFTGVIDPVTIPRSLPGLMQVTARGAFVQPEANALYQAMVRCGMTSYQPVAGSEQAPMEYLMAYLTSPAGRERFDIAPLDLPMAAQVEVAGRSGGRDRRLVYEAHDMSRRASTSTAARAALMLARGALGFTGVRAPEGCIDPPPFLAALMAETDTRVFAWEDDGSDPAPLVL